MADPITPTPGKDTSEFSITKLLAWFGIAVTVLGALAEVVKELLAAFQNIPSGSSGVGLWVAIIGALVTVIPAAIYKFSRLSLKAKAVEAATQASLAEMKARVDAAP